MSLAPLDPAHEAAEFYRHYSNLRFTIFTVFTALTGGLVALFSTTSSGFPALQLQLLKAGGILIAVVFGLYQWRLATLLDTYGSRLEELLPGLAPGGSSKVWNRIIGGAVLLVHVGVALFWLVFLFVGPSTGSDNHD